MKKFALISAWLVVASTAGCFAVDLSGAVFTCDPNQSGGCPEGQQCSSKGLCGTTETGQNPDLGDPSFLGEAEGCPLDDKLPGKGFLVSATGKPKVYACPALFSSKPGPTADAQCRAPYTLCRNGNNIDQNACLAAGKFMGGFFIGNGAVNRALLGFPPTCAVPTIIPSTMWPGCGLTATSSSLALAAISCYGFTTALGCNTGDLTCGGTNITDATNTKAASGVLCCAP